MLTMMPMAACDGSNADPILPEQPGQPGNSDGGDEDDSTDPTNPIPGGNGRYLVLYCSRTGSTERMAQQIQQTLDCDILEVEPQTPYESDYNGMLNRAQEELAAIRQEIIRRLKLRLKISATMISCLSAIRFGTVVWPHRCRHSCIIMLRNLQVSVSLFLPAVAAAASLHQLTRRGRFAPVPLSPKHCF